MLVEQVYVNGQGPMRFLVDTGADSCALSEAAARRAGIVPAWRVELARSSKPGAIELLPAAAAKSVRIGAVEQHNVEVLLGDAMAEVNRLSRDIDGVLGQSFLQGIGAYTIDNRRGALFLNVQSTPRGKPIGFDLESHRPRLELMVEGRPRRVVLDSGAPELILIGQDRGLLPTNGFDSVHVNNRQRFVILQQK